LGIIRAASTHEDYEQARTLFSEYAQGLSVDLCFQNFEQELHELPGAYAPPLGALLLAEVDGVAAGCVAVRPLESGICELKRLYVRSGSRGAGLGRRLTAEAMQSAREMGYTRIRLDTLPEMHAAQKLYESLGFYDIPSYYDSPIPGKRCLEAALN
jgi:ribosomal protein S18 acetylase RimI-like enzyme